MSLPAIARSVIAPAIALALASAIAAPARAEILDTGDDTARVAEPDPVQSVVTSSCRIAWYRQGGSDGELDRLRALGYDITVVGRNQLSYPELEAWDAVVIAYTEPGFLAQQQPHLQAFVDTGGGLLIHQPNHAGVADYTPVGFSVEIADPVWCSPTGFANHLDNASHPITAGLADADLSGAFDGVASLGPAFTVLASSPECGSVSLAAGTSGIGRVLFDTGNGAPISVQPGSEAYWDALFGWLCTPGPIGVEPVTFGSLKAAYR